VAEPGGGYLKLIGAQARGQAQYRASFWFEVVSSVLFGVLDLVAVLVTFHAGGTLGGFRMSEGLVMAGVAGTGFALADLAVGSVERLRLYIRTGTLDAVLLRPLGALRQLIAMDFAPRRAGRVVVMTIILIVAAAWADVDWTPVHVALVVVAVLSGAVLFSAVFVAGATVAFWWIDSGEFANGFTYGGRDLTSYPMTIYGGFFRRVFAYGLGFAFAGYYPTLVLLDRPDPLGAPAWLGWAAPGVSALATLAAALFWRTGVRHYRSTGS
jgi:ABC-2 type transport system permease protein